jgi:hypothetical protein
MLHLERVDDEERSTKDHNGDDENPTPIFQIEAGHVSLPEVMVVLEGMQERDKLGVYRGHCGEAIFWVNDGEQPPFDAPCLSHECAAWLAAFVWRRFQAFLRASEVRQLCLVLAGRAPDAVPAWVQERDDLALLDKSPTVAAVVAFMEWQSTATVEMRVAILWMKLHAIAKENGLLKIGPHRFPAGPASLSRRLSLEWPVLARFGITGRIWRSDGAHVRLTRDPDADAWESPASETPSAPKPCENSGFDHARTRGRDFATSPAPHPRNHRGVICVPRGEEDDDD